MMATVITLQLSSSSMVMGANLSSVYTARQPGKPPLCVLTLDYRLRKTARAAAPSCPPTFIGSTIKS